MPPVKLAVVAGAGPAGLTFAHELLKENGYAVLILEPEAQVGGLARTVEHRGNRMDIGGHRFFSKSDRVLAWWADMLPFELAADTQIGYQNKSRMVRAEELPRALPGSDECFRVRPRVSRIYHDRRFFDYPVSLSPRTLRQLGAGRLLAILGSYAVARLTAFREPRNLEEFFIQRFGRRLYETFFKSYTEKVWGRSCVDISARWGAQRVKSLSVWAAVRHAAVKLLGGAGTETSLIERFLYPHFGPGQLWEETARRVTARGGEIRLRRRVSGVEFDGTRVVAVTIEDADTGARVRQECDLFVSTMPVKDLIAGFEGPVPEEVRATAQGLEYRDFITVGLLVDRLIVEGATAAGLIRDSWIYVQEPDVKLGRIQIYNNWSAGMVADQSKAWLGLEYFCREGDELWRMTDAELAAFAAEELARIGFIVPGAVRDSAVLRVPKAYPAYWGAYERFSVIRAFVDAIPNLHLIGRNGMHRYNNQDHSMLAAMTAVEHIRGAGGRAAVWAVNADEEYHEG